MIYLLTGPKHCGKTSAGEALSRLTGLAFIDLDALVRERTGKSPRDLYREGAFPKAEAEALATVIDLGGSREDRNEKKGLIAAAGGGLCDNAEAMAALGEARGKKPPGAICVYLEAPAALAWERVLESAKTGGLPPFLDPAAPERSHRALHERRATLYQAFADCTVHAAGKTPEQIAHIAAGELGLV